MYDQGSAAWDLEGQLGPGEQVLWAGRPDPKRLFARGDLFLVPFSILWAGFAVFWELSALTTGTPFFAIWGIPFVAMGAYITVGRFVLKASRKRRTTYAITNQRIIVAVAGSSRRSTSISLDRLPAISENIRRDGSGDIVFGTSAFGAGLYANSGLEAFANQRNALPVAFYDLPDARTPLSVLQSRPAGYNRW